jgi:hypothetical protein
VAHHHTIECISDPPIHCKVTGESMTMEHKFKLPSWKGKTHSIKVITSRHHIGYDALVIADQIGIVMEENGHASPGAAFNAAMTRARETYPEEFGGRHPSEGQPGKLTADQARALGWFAKKNGRTWKSQLNLMWQDGRDADQIDGHLLRQVRNNLGPSWLIRTSLADIQKIARS